MCEGACQSTHLPCTDPSACQARLTKFWRLAAASGEFRISNAELASLLSHSSTPRMAGFPGERSDHDHSSKTGWPGMFCVSRKVCLELVLCSTRSAESQKSNSHDFVIGVTGARGGFLLSAPGPFPVDMTPRFRLLSRGCGSASWMRSAAAARTGEEARRPRSRPGPH